MTVVKKFLYLELTIREQLQMKYFVLTMLVLSLLFMGCGLKNGDSGPVDNSTVNKIRLVWHGKADREITIAWDQRRGKDPLVCYGTGDAGSNWEAYPLTMKPTRNTAGYRGMNTQFARLTNLDANTVYYFVIRDNDSTSKRYWFRTAPDKPQAFTFIAGGDSKSSGTALEAGRLSNQMVAKLRPLFIVYNGDFCSNATDDDQWKQWLNDWSLLTTSEDGRMYPIIPVHGNHENGDKTVLNKLFDVPFQNDKEEDIYYSTSFGGTFFHVIALNSEIEEGGVQRQWLEDDLKSHENFTFKLAGYHKPFRPHTAGKSEQDNQMEQWAGLFYKYGLDISMDGDSHMSKITFPIRPSDQPGSFQGFIRDDKNGTMYIGEGSWGASPRANNDDKPWTLRSGSFNQIKWLQVFPDSGDKPAHIDIRTVITATEDEDENLVSHIDKVASLSEDDVFAVPENIDLFSTDPYGPVITYPFSE
jgi:hypothetical protein